MTVLTTPSQIQTARLMTLRKGIQLEQRGLKMSRGRSCLAIARTDLGLSRGTAATRVLAELDRRIAEALA
jgi:hypothetical protein